jgi:Tol biopolymer transport system component
MFLKIIPAPLPPKLRRAVRIGAAIGVFGAFSACAAPQVRAPDISVSVVADSQRRELTVAPGTTVANLLARAGIELGALDRVTPPLYSLAADGATVRVIRVVETFEVEQVAIPFQRQIVHNEALPPDETRLVQAGEEGLQEITYRVLTEDGVETSRTPLRTTLIKAAVPEILMIGSSASFGSVAIRGALAYVDGGNAWILTGDSDNRFPLVASSDLDSRVFAVSPDGQWLLYSRSDAAKLNTLWVAATFGGDPPFSLPVYSIAHFADWSPAEKRTIAFSTVEPVAAAPGWKAANDLRLISFDEKQNPSAEKILLAANTEGAYSWWGAAFAWSPDGTRLAYARPDEIGWISAVGGSRHPLLEIAPYHTLADWVWLPPIRWTPDGAFLLTLRHGDPLGNEVPGESPVFDLIALPASGGPPIALQTQAGMFAAPAPGPLTDRAYEQGYNVAFFQAVRPLESDRSKYRLMVADRDGSNLTAVFPSEGEPGLSAAEAGAVEWSPDGTQLALIYEGNLWIIDLAARQGQQLTGDGQVTAIDWK